MKKRLRDIEVQDKRYGYYRAPKISGEVFLRVFLWGVAGLAIIFVLNTVNVIKTGENLKRELSSSTFEGFELLLSGSKNASSVELESAKDSFRRAESNFAEMEKSLWFVSGRDMNYGKNSDLLRSARLVTESGGHFANAGKFFLEAMEELEDVPAYFLQIENDAELPPITEKLAKGLEATRLAVGEIEQAGELIEQINVDSLPSELQKRVASAQGLVHELTGTLTDVTEFFPAILELMGHEEPHRYLVILQNNNEIRATGGFIGSYLVVEIDQGQITEFRVEDVYDLQRDMNISKPPEQMHWVADEMFFRDSNYSIDFPSSARLLLETFRREGGGEVDTVVALNQSSLESFLRLTGPVMVEGFGEFDSENYNLLLTYMIESKAFGAEDPKKILKMFVPEFQKKILNKDFYDEIVAIVYEEVNKKNVLAFSNDENVQGFFGFLGVDGRVETDSVDFLAVAHSSIGGTKSDHFIEETIEHVTDISEDGVVRNTVTVKRKHMWNDTVLDYWKGVLGEYGVDQPEDYVVNILGRGRNKNIVKVYVPKNSKLLDTNIDTVLHEYDPDLDKDYFVFTMEVLSGEEEVAYFEYELEEVLDDSLLEYSLYVAKQPGSRGSLLNKVIKGGDFERIGIYPDDYSVITDDRIGYFSNLVYDRYFAMVLSR